MGALTEKKIDCHNHILDPGRYPYSPQTRYHPAGQEIGTEHQLHTICDFYGVDHCLVVEPNSGYGPDNRCLLNAIAGSNGRFKGVAVVANDAGHDELLELQARGIVGIAFNATYHGTDYYQNVGPLLQRMAALGLFAQFQVEGDQLIDLLPLIHRSDVALIFDHCGRPVLANGLQQPGFAALLDLARRPNIAVKLSGFYKFSAQPFPYQDAWPVMQALVNAFGIERCLWGSDWPYLRAPVRIDYGPLLCLVDKMFPSAADRHQLLWETPRRLFGFPQRD